MCIRSGAVGSSWTFRAKVPKVWSEAQSTLSTGIVEGYVRIRLHQLVITTCFVMCGEMRLCNRAQAF
jgi:hypothetical protein